MMATITTLRTEHAMQAQAAQPTAAAPTTLRRYIYCITNPDIAASLGPVGIGDNAEVYTIAGDGCAAVVSAITLEKLDISRANALAHQRVMEAVMQRGHTVLPVRFNTIAEPKGPVTADQRIVNRVLTERRDEILELLATMGPLVELGVKGLWTGMETVFKDLVENDREIQSLRRRLLGGSSAGSARKGPVNMTAQIKLGEMVKKALIGRKYELETTLHSRLSPMAVDTRKNKTFGDPMFANLALLVDKSRQQDVQTALSDFQAEHADSIKLRCVGPLPACNFLELVIRWDD